MGAANWTGTQSGAGLFEQIGLTFTSISESGGTITGEFTAAPDLNFEVHATEDLVGGTFQMVTGFVGTATTESFTDDAGGTTNRVYQLRVQP